MSVPEHLTGHISATDYLPEGGLAAIEALVPKVPTDFDLGHVQAARRSVTLTLKFDRDADPLTRGSGVDSLLQAAMCVDTLAKNLRAERAARGAS